MKQFGPIAAIVLLAACVASPPSTETLETAVEAADAGDYATSQRIFQKFAEAGDAWAQYFLGVQYSLGRGVEQDQNEAARWWRKAAEQPDVQCGVDCYRGDWLEGHALAQFALGFIYEKNPNVRALADSDIPQSYAQALYWYRRAGQQGLRRARLRIPIVEAKIRIAANGVPIPSSVVPDRGATHGGARIELLMNYRWQGVAANASGAISVSARGTEGDLSVALSPGGDECQGRWQREDGPPEQIAGSFGTWFIRCDNGLAASGFYEMTADAAGNGQGEDTQGRTITFIFEPPGISI